MTSKDEPWVSPSEEQEPTDSSKQQDAIDRALAKRITPDPFVCGEGYEPFSDAYMDRVRDDETAEFRVYHKRGDYGDPFDPEFSGRAF